MARLNIQFPRFSDVYAGITMRAFIRQLETMLNSVKIMIGAAYSVVLSSHIVDINDSLLYCDTTDSDIVITLPIVTTDVINARFEIIIKKKVAAHSVIINKTGADTIDAGSSLTLSAANSFYRLRAIEGGWITI